MHNLRGFTLIELLIALALFSIISLLAWRGLNTVLQSRAAVEAPGRAALELAAAWTQLEADLQAARTALVIAPSPGGVAASAPLPHIVASAQRLTLLRAPAQCPGCWQGVVYDIAQREGRTVLRRRTTALYTDATAAQMALEALAQQSVAATEHVLLQGAAGMRIGTWRESPDGVASWLSLGTTIDNVFQIDPVLPGSRKGRAKSALKVEWEMDAPWHGWVSKVVLLENRW